ncbi:MAG TPA: hypothetical protein VF263_03110 [Longimicrobiaceae bacterium]
MSLQATLETYASRITSRNSDQAPYRTLTNAALLTHPTTVVQVTKPADAVVATVVATGAVGPPPTFRFDMMVMYAKLVDQTSHATTTYGNVKADPYWQRLYDVAVRPIPYIEAGVASNKHVESVACMDCGLLLPLTHMTVDHQRPQAGGELEAVLKVLRTLGLTMEGPKGQKGKKVQDHLFRGAGLTAVQTRPNRPASAGVSMDARYTLTETGAVFLSVVHAAGGFDELKRRCMNNFLNLAPRCQPCNSSRGNPLKYP